MTFKMPEKVKAGGSPDANRRKPYHTDRETEAQTGARSYLVHAGLGTGKMEEEPGLS